MATCHFVHSYCPAPCPCLALLFPALTQSASTLFISMFGFLAIRICTNLSGCASTNTVCFLSCFPQDMVNVLYDKTQDAQEGVLSMLLVREQHKYCPVAYHICSCKSNVNKGAYQTTGSSTYRLKCFQVSFMRFQCGWPIRWC